MLISLLLMLSPLSWGAVWTVSSSGGDFTAIQDAIDAADDGDRIEVDAGTWAESLNLSGKDLELVGVPGETVLAPDGTALRYSQGESGSLEGFVIQADGEQALVVIGGSPHLQQVLIEDAGSGTETGGAVQIQGGSPSFTDITIRNAAGAQGGALYVTGGALATLTDVTIQDPSAQEGAGIFLDSASIEARSLRIEGAASQSDGGGIYLRASSLYAEDLELEDITVDDGNGQGLFLDQRSSVELIGGHILNSRLTVLGGQSFGGGIAAQDSSQVTLMDFLLEGNLSDLGGGISMDGGSLTLDNVELIGNDSSSRGGALHLRSGAILSSSNTLLQDNSSGDGGGLYAGTNSVVVIDDSSWEENLSTGEGGAITVKSAYSFELTDSSLITNTAEGDGGALLLDGVFEPASWSSVSLSGNRSRSGDGGGLAMISEGELQITGGQWDRNETTVGDGGAVYVDGDDAVVLSLDSLRFQDNVAGGRGGALALEAVLRFELLDSVLLENEAEDEGGGLASVDSTELVLERVLLARNIAEEGGGWWSRNTSLELIQYSRLMENEATQGGGSFLLEGNDSEWINNSFVGNSASDAGGHLYAETGTVRLLNNIFYQASDGGGVFGDDSVSAGSDLFYNNAFENSGGDWTGSLSDPTGSSGNINEDPLFVDYSLDGDETNDSLFLQLSSPCVDAGHPSTQDRDGSPADIGAYGGLGADVEDADGDGAFTNTDCDDSDSSICPACPEIPYDGIDQDCDGADQDDVDEDSYVAEEAGGADCDDEDATVNPAATEIWYDGVDQDCDGASDFDADSDGHDVPIGGGEDCDDSDPERSPSADEIWYDGVDQDCDGESDFDADQDGYEAEAYGGSDCNDEAPLTYPGAPEILYDGYDQDCDGEDITDLDGDGYDAREAGGVDCDDEDPSIYPGAEDLPYDGVDSDCDGLSEYDQDGDGFDTLSSGGGDCDDSDHEINPAAFEVWYDGVDQDCDGASDYDRDRDGYDAEAYGGTDCDDGDPSAHPGAWEVWYDGVDQDCRGDGDFDRDADGYSDREDCDDSRPEAYPGAPELENSLDDDCDGWAEDEDRDADGLSDWDEWELTSDHENPDTDGDGRLDGEEMALSVADLDLDGLVNALDVDDDGDGISTQTEDLEDIDGDGQADQDVDSDGVPNCYDLDSDGDGYTDLEEGPEDEDRDGIPEYVDYTGDYQGSGCAGGPGGVQWMLLLGFGFGWGRRLRRELYILPLLFLFVSPLSFASSSAQSLHWFGTGGDTLRYHRLAYPDGGRWGEAEAILLADYAREPLLETFPSGDNEVLIQGLSSASLGLGLAVGGGGRLELILPGHAGAGGSFGSFTSAGEMKLGATVPVLRRRDARPGVALVPTLWSPLGGQGQTMRSELGGGGVVSVAQEIGPFGWAVNLGARFGKVEEDRNMDLGTGPLAGLGVHYRIVEGLTATLETTAQGAVGWDLFPAETSLGLQSRLESGLYAMLGGAVGLNDAPGSPAWRALAAVGWSRRYPPPVELELPSADAEDGPDDDPDGDGIPNSLDACPYEAETVDGFDDEDGCPELDGDGDGVPFAMDACPREPIYPEQDPAYSNGCPKLAEVVGDQIVLSGSIFFREDSFILLPQSAPTLQAVADLILEESGLDGILVEGHTNSNGSREYNYRLSELRAQAVVRWLIQAGVDRNRLFVKGFGKDQPLVEDSHPDAQRINRRVEFTLVDLRDVPDEDRMPSSDVLPSY